MWTHGSVLPKHKGLWIGGSLCLLLFLLALLAPWIAPYSPTDQELSRGLEPPSLQHPFGLDKLGRDILSRVLYGSRISLQVGLITVTVAGMAGVLIGAVAGYGGGMLDEAIMRIADIFQAFPGILLAIALMAVLGPSLHNVIIALTVMGWVSYARLVRGQILFLREEEFVLAAQAAGAPSRRIVIRHLLPNLAAPLIVEGSFGMAGAIIAEAGLSFLGLGVQPPTPSWGAMLNEGRPFLLVAPHRALLPGLAIMLTVLALNMLGDGLRDWLDPGA
ncbi:MAG: ABC transporter permease [Nitrospinota bacterium]|nr:MAG: ABC transporter permease [Nitrospinota bacterium]